MTIAAQSIIRRATDTLQDQTSVQWPVAELVRYLNDGQREVILYRPDAMVTFVTAPCVAGSRQTLPANGAKLIEVSRNNSAASKRAVTALANRRLLDSQVPNWHSIAGSNEVLHYIYDPRDPKTFYVYPPATTNAALDIAYSAYPTDIVEPADGTTYTAVSGNVSLPDIYGNALLDYVLYRAYAKDSETGNAARAQAHYAAFANALGVEVKATVAVAPGAAPATPAA